MKTLLHPRQDSSTHGQRAFSLLEMLVVVGIILLVASSAILVLDHEDDQRRFEQTRADYREIHDAIFGPRGSSMADSGQVSGFLADTGRLPRSLDELLARPADLPGWGPITTDGLDLPGMGGRLYHGWRGPYIGRFRASLNDPWGNPWIYIPPDPQTGTPMVLGSLGRNGMPGGGDVYDRSFPEVLEIESGYFSVTSVPLPSKTIGFDREGDKTEFGPFVLGLLHTGVNLNDRFANHPSLVRDPQNPSEVYWFEPRGFKWKNRGRPNERKEFKDKESFRLPQNLFYSGAPFVRQFQYVAYDPSRPGPLLRHKLVSIDPHVMTYHPQTSASGYWFPDSGKHQVDWLIPDT